jgi:tetratricopeptide (TPR) repeat protein
MLIGAAFAQHALAQEIGGAAIYGIVRGTVRDSANKLIADASVLLEEKGHPGGVEAKTNAEGAFVFSALQPGTYTLTAEKSGLRGRATHALVLSQGDEKHIDLVLEAGSAVHSNSVASPSPSTEAMQFADQPNFTVAGITDWTAAGGHGSDTSLRTSEALTRETLTLKPGDSEHGSAASTKEASESESRLRAALASAPGSFAANQNLGEFYLREGRYADAIPLLKASYQIDPTNRGSEYDLALACKGIGDLSKAREHVQKMLAEQDTGNLHRLLGDLDEEMGDSLAAVREDEQAAHLDPSEQNYFEWGSELLLHRAVRPAAEVFAKGAAAHPKSARMLAALGAALFAGGFYDEAALRICDASDLNPADPAPYLFLGKIELAAPLPLACAEQKLARFAKEQPANALANYYYAMAVWKSQKSSENPQALQQVQTLLEEAVKIDPKFGEAYLQLGIFFFSQHDFEKAIGFYTKAIEIDRQLGDAHYRLGLAYQRIGERAKAKQEFQLHDEIDKQQAAVIERQRREVKQFLVVLKGPPTFPSAN